MFALPGGPPASAKRFIKNCYRIFPVKWWNSLFARRWIGEPVWKLRSTTSPGWVWRLTILFSSALSMSCFFLVIKRSALDLKRFHRHFQSISVPEQQRSKLFCAVSLTMAKNVGQIPRTGKPVLIHRWICAISLTHSVQYVLALWGGLLNNYAEALSPN